jgi:hypothetical protein
MQLRDSRQVVEGDLHTAMKEVSRPSATTMPVSAWSALLVWGAIKGAMFRRQVVECCRAAVVRHEGQERR